MPVGAPNLALISALSLCIVSSTCLDSVEHWHCCLRWRVVVQITCLCENFGIVWQELEGFVVVGFGFLRPLHGESGHLTPVSMLRNSPVTRERTLEPYRLNFLLDLMGWFSPLANQGPLHDASLHARHYWRLFMCKLCSDIGAARLMPYIQVFAQTLKFAPLTRPVCIDIQESGLSDAECEPETTSKAISPFLRARKLWQTSLLSWIQQRESAELEEAQPLFSDRSSLVVVHIAVIRGKP